MNQATTPQAPAPTAEPASEAQTYAQRAADVFGPDDPSVHGGDGNHGAMQAPAAAPAPVETEAQVQARAARRAALAKVQERERESVDARTAIRDREELRGKLAKLEEQNKAYANHIDPSKLTKEQFFQLAEKNPELTPKELGEWLRERMADPNAAAARAAKTAVDPEIQQLRQQIADQAKALEAMQSQSASARSQAEETQYAHELHAFVNENAQHAPLTARFVAAKGLQGLYDAALSVAQRLPEGAGPQAVLDELEESLVAGQRDWAAIYGATSPPQRHQAFTPPSQAAAKAPMHVSNTLAQQRSSVVDEQADFGKLPLAERANRLFST